MAIGSTQSLTGYTIGGKALGVQIGNKSATELLGGGSAASLFAATLNGSSGGITVTATDIAVKGMQDQIDRIQGYRTNLTVAEKQDLADYQSKIQHFNDLASVRVLTNDEVSDRADAYVEAYKILGKEYVDFTNDATVTNLSSQLEKLIATKPVGPEAVRLERLQNTLSSLDSQISNSDSGSTELITSRAISVAKQINKLTAARPMASLTADERSQHDDLVEQINNYVGFDLELTSKQKEQIERLQTNISLLQQGASSSGGGMFV